jgi:hypothetical protein
VPATYHMQALPKYLRSRYLGNAIDWAIDKAHELHDSGPGGTVSMTREYELPIAALKCTHIEGSCIG